MLLSDNRMPDMSGVDFLSKVRSMYPDTVRILYGENDDVEAARQAINAAAVYEFMEKAGDPEELKRVLDDAFQIYHQSAGAKQEVHNSRLRVLRN